MALDNELKLGYVVYKVITGSITLPYNSELYGKGGYHAFLNSRDYFATNTDFSMQYRKSFDAVNKALARLQQYDKLPYFYAKAKVYKEDGEYAADISDIPYKEVVNVFRKTGHGGWDNYDFTIQGKKLFIGERYPLTERETEDGEERAFGRVEIEYKKRIPIFQEDDIIVDSVDDSGVGYSDNSPNLADYGLSPIDVTYVIYYAQADILSEIDPVTAGNQLSMAENYFGDMEEFMPTFSPRKLRRRF